MVRKLIKAVKKEGIAQKYLIQHSAGSGKSHSIAWLADQLSSLHNKNNDVPYFDMVIVITDRTVLDDQLKEKIKQSQTVEGVFVAIDRDSDNKSKSEKLSKALQDKTGIISVTIQTFPFVLDEIQKKANLRKKKFAIIADEAHSSQSGKTAIKMKKLLKTDLTSEEITSEDVINATVEEKHALINISFFAFTATPKQKTMELFGRPPNPNEPTSETNLPKPFHIYTMQQAIEEGFILDVLKDYTTYKTALKIQSHDGERKVDCKKATLKLKEYIRLHPHAIAQKIDIILNHFASSIKHLLNNQAKAMVVTSSRKEAVRYKIEFDRFLEKHKADSRFTKIHAMVAFSGKVIDDVEGDQKEYTESNMNPKLYGRKIRDAFKTDDYQVMLVANKFQTGFDEPKLCAMYIDRKLQGIDAVQTLSRLNRTYPGKDHVFILDFVNKAEEIQEAFAPYYKNTELTDVTDPNLVYEIYEASVNYSIFTEQEIDDYAAAYYQKKNLQKLMSAAIKPAADRFKERYRRIIELTNQYQANIKAAESCDDEVSIKNYKSLLKEVNTEKSSLLFFKKQLISYIRMYDFLSQIYDYKDASLEKFSSFARGLVPNLHITEEPTSVDIGDVVLTNYKLIHQGSQAIDLKEGRIGAVSRGQAQPREKKTEVLKKIIDQFNSVFSGDFSDNDAVDFVAAVKEVVKQDEKTMSQIHANEKHRAMEGRLPKAVRDVMVKMLDIHPDLCKQALESDEKMALITSIVADYLYHEKASSGQPIA